MKKFFLSQLLIFTHFAVFAQTDSIQNEIKNYADSKIELITKSRRMIADKLAVDEYDKIRVIKDYLIDYVEDENNVAFDTDEYWLILYWTQDFTELLNNLTNFGLQTVSGELNRNIGQPVVINDLLYDKLLKKSRDSEKLLELFIQNASIGLEKQDFLKLHLQFCLADYSLNPNFQDSLNVQSDEFLSKYPYSAYAPFVKKVIRLRMKDSDFAYGYDLFGGFIILKGDIANNLSNPGSIGLSFNLFYKKMYLNCSLEVCGSELQKDIEYQPYIWESGSMASIFIPRIHIGYAVLDNRRYNIAPFSGVSVVNISPIYEDILSYPYLENIYFTSNVSWSIGLSLNFFSKNSRYFIYRSNANQFQIYANLKYLYTNLLFDDAENNLNGSMHQISLAFGIVSRKSKRIL
jgi:hypothetical protein